MSEREYTTKELVAWLKQDAQFSEEHARLKYAVHPSVLGVALSECARTKAAAAEIERLTAALDAAPVREELLAHCFCGTCWLNSSHEEWVMTSCDGYMEGADAYCPDCGAQLGADGTARRWRERGE